VLTAVGLAVVLAALLVLATRTGRARAEDGPVWTVRGRGPPRHVPSLARRLATLSVLRT
jgi:hypothetical protein